MATRVQRKVLWAMLDNGGEILIATGYKTVKLGTVKTTAKQYAGQTIVCGNLNLTGGLQNMKFAEPIGDMRWRITDAGRDAMGRRVEWN